LKVDNLEIFFLKWDVESFELFVGFGIAGLFEGEV